MTASMDDAPASSAAWPAPLALPSDNVAARRLPPACLDAERDLRSGAGTGPTPFAGVVALKRTTRFRGAGLLSRLRSAGGDVGREAEDGAADGCALPARTCRLVWRAAGRSFWDDDGCWLSPSGPAAEDVDRLRALRRRVAMAGPALASMSMSPPAAAAEAAAAAAAAAPPSDAEAPSLRRAFVRALSFIGIGISSSELSWRIEYCCCCSGAAAATAAAAAAPEVRFKLPAIVDAPAAPLTCDRDGGRRRACRADVRRPSDVKWLPWLMGVGDTAAIVVDGQREDVPVARWRGSLPRVGQLRPRRKDYGGVRMGWCASASSRRKTRKMGLLSRKI